MKLCGIKKTYGDRITLALPDLELEAGKITAVLGESGAGKTTLLNIVSGMTSHEGTVEGAGRTSYLFQDPMLLPHLTVEGNLRFVLEKGTWGEISAMLARVGLAGREASRPRELSGGERQRVALARAFLYPHDTLLMDEPFSSLGLSLKKSLLSLTRELWRERRQTVLFVTHDVREALCLAHRAIVLRRGTLCGDFNLGEGERDFFAPQPMEEALYLALTQDGPAE